MDRFSLLLLEPGEIYFQDFAVTYHGNHEVTKEFQDNVKTLELRGRLKICSKSIVFVPSSDDILSPLFKFPLGEIALLQEWAPKSFRSKLAAKRQVLSLDSKSRIDMMDRNMTAPFTFKQSKIEYRYIFALEYGKVDDYLPVMSQLQRACSLPPVEQNGMIAAIVYSVQSRSEFDARFLESVLETVLFKTVGNKITPLVVNPGRIVLTNVNLYFQAYNNAETEPVLKVKLSSIKRIFQRRYLLRPLGLEIEYLNPRKRDKQNIYLTFTKPEDRMKLYHKIIAQNQNLNLEEYDLGENNMTLQWQNGVVSNFEYLLYLNSAADRSFNDLTQYPVMPWVIQDYTSQKLDLKNPKSFRDLSRPMGALNEKRLRSLKDRTADMPEPRFLYGSHYSTPGFVLYFLVRKIPECMLCLQNGRFDQPDRMFNSVPQTWINVTTHQSDFKELVPEFYMPENKGDFLVNSNNIDFGVRHDGEVVNNVELPLWAEGDPERFVKILREALETDYVSYNLHKWIDLIFGYKQRGIEAEKADNIFYHLCYEGSIDMDQISDLEQRYALEVQIGEFGQVPKQLFTSPHPHKRIKFSNELFLINNKSRDFKIQNTKIIEDLSDLTVKQWKPMDKLVRVCDYKVHKEALTSVSISIDNLWIFSASHDSTLKMYSLEETHILRSISVSTMSLSCCIPLPNNKTVLLGSWDNNLCSYSIEFGRTSDFLPIHSDAVSCMDWRKGILATGSWDSSIKLWHCNEANGYRVRLSNDMIRELEHNSHVTCLHICPDNSQLVSGTRDGNVTLWCLRAYDIIQQLPGHKRQVNSVQFSPDCTRVISCGSDFYMKVIDLKTGSILFSKDLGEELNCLAWDGTTVIVAGGSGQIQLWNLHQVEFVTKFQAHTGPVKTLCVSDDGKYIVSGGDDRRVIVWSSSS